jgi:hypothetical protein
MVTCIGTAVSYLPKTPGAASSAETHGTQLRYPRVHSEPPIVQNGTNTVIQERFYAKTK